MVKPVAIVSVVPNLPEPLQRLQEFAYNLRWAWNHEAIALFRRLDRDLWDRTGHNPVAMLGTLSQERLQAACDDSAFMAHYHRVLDDFDSYMQDEHTWYAENHSTDGTPVYAYFSMEFGITECVQNYSGGLGILSGDHLKSASDLGIPLIGVGLLYQEGYFRQYLNADGYQQENYPLNDWANLPVTLMRKADGSPLKISVPMPGRQLHAQVWKMQIGRNPLFLLDSNIAENPLEEDRNLTDRLYGGDRRTRIRQEVLMGIGGIRALEAMGYHPDVCHMNEGHSAFMALERIRLFMKQHNLSFYQARDILAASNIFTTHTPVPAGLERFGYDLIDEHFSTYWGELGLSRDQFIALGRESMGDYELFSMAVLALNLSGSSNGVAKLHGVVSRHLWQWMYPNIPQHEIPIGSITNGIHTQTWVSSEMAALLDRYLNPRWRTEEYRADIWAEIDNIPDTELWRTHERRRERLIAFARKQVAAALQKRGAPQSEIEAASELLNPDALTIGFARRFATYKRATMLFREPERLAKLLNDPERPVQLIFAGKAHPHDTEGKEFIRQIVRLSRMPEFRHSIVFLEDYDMNIARYLVQGVDVWLNNPRRPKEASGTSGMKVIYNGGLNCSILDGWWDEGYDPSVGWAIGNGEEYPESQADLQDYVESSALYNLLEREIIPMYYERTRDDVPREWVAKVKASFKKLAPMFNTHRMVQEYTDLMYVPAYRRLVSMTTPDLSNGLNFSEWRYQLGHAWSQVQVVSVDVAEKSVQVGRELEVKAVVNLGTLTPKDVRVQLYYAPLTTRGELGSDGEAVNMEPVNGSGSGTHHSFSARVAYPTSGDRGLSVRVVPHHEALSSDFQLGIVQWA
ncbi:MAG: alpha-glucan family phosphorylase [bacterium]|nr:alpha-glucan family phosphorylase [bacterium]